MSALAAKPVLISGTLVTVAADAVARRGASTRMGPGSVAETNLGADSVAPRPARGTIRLAHAVDLRIDRRDHPWGLQHRL